MKQDPPERDRQRKEIFQRLLVAMWLRPERALIDAYILETAYRFLTLHLQKKSFEFGCLDGVPSFAMLGGEFADDYDDYAEVVFNRQKRTHNLTAGGGRPDYFDYFDSSYDYKPVKKFASQRFSFGTSHKRSHIVKAERLGLYGNLWDQSLTDPFPQVLADIELVHAPMLFWLDTEKDLLTVLQNLNKSSKHDARLITAFPKNNHQNYQILEKIKNVDPVWRRLIEAGIPESLNKTNKSLEQLEAIFMKAGYKLDCCQETVPLIVSQFYQIGFRPLFPVLIDMRQKLLSISTQEALSIKRKWINTLLDFMLPLCESGWMEATEMPNTWWVLSLRKF